MPERFYASNLALGPTVCLEGEEAHHLARVRRIRVGESVQLFDGSGMECRCSVREIHRESVVLDIESHDWISRELPFSLTLACAVAKGDRLRWLVEKATELGVVSFVPIITERSRDRAQHLRPDRTARWIIEASKQCGRNVLMRVEEPVVWTDYVASLAATGPKVIADPRGIPVSQLCRDGRSEAVFAAVGPEGGFTDAELRSARDRGWTSVCLGSRILRVETAALVLVTHLAQEE